MDKNFNFAGDVTFLQQTTPAADANLLTTLLGAAYGAKASAPGRRLNQSPGRKLNARGLHEEANLYDACYGNASCTSLLRLRATGSRTIDAYSTALAKREHPRDPAAFR
jgi:hypothetical protein